ncbi:MAG: DUF6438 domain-containing protein [Bacteroidota bacterium]
MKKKLISLATVAITPIAGFLFAALLFTSCSKNEMDDLLPSSSTSSSNIPLEKKSNNIAATGLSSNPREFDGMISISHGECFGMCPSYSISVSKEGTVVYNGERNVGILGTVTYSINPDVALELALHMERGGFFGFLDQYPLVPDAQRNETSLLLNGRIKVVVDYGVGIPLELKMMRAEVEKVLNVQRFIEGTVDPAVINTK